MKKTAQIIRRFAFEEWGGTENVVWNSSRSLPEYGFSSEIIATTACSRNGDETCQQIPIHRFPCFYPFFPMTSARRTAMDKKGGNPVCTAMRNYLMAQDFDLYHAHSGGRIAQLVREVARKKNKPYVLSFHGGYGDVPESEKKKMLEPQRHTIPYGRLFDLFYGWRGDPLADAAGLICVGANEPPKIQELYPNQKVIFLPNGIHPEHFRKQAELNLRKHLGIPRNRKILLCVSRIDYQKNQKQLLKILAELLARKEDWHVLMIGPVSVPEYYNEMLAEAKGKHLTDHLTVVPGTSPESELMRAAYQQSDLFLLPSHHEPFGIVILEAWASGLPVIAAEVGGMKYLVKNGITGILCESDDTAGYLAAISCLEDETVRSQLISNASETVELYSWKRIAARLALFYDEVLGS